MMLHITTLTLSWLRPLSNRNQSIDLQSKSMDWFLYDNGLRHERVNHKHKMTKDINQQNIGVWMSFNKTNELITYKYCFYKQKRFLSQVQICSSGFLVTGLKYAYNMCLYKVYWILLFINNGPPYIQMKSSLSPDQYDAKGSW